MQECVARHVITGSQVAVEVVVEEEITGVIIVVRRLIGVDMAKYIVDLPDSFNENDRRTLAYNGVLMHPIPYEESVGIYKGVLEFLKVADKYSLEKIYGVNSLKELFNSLSVSDIVDKYKTEVSKYKRVSELADDIGLFELRSIVNDLYVSKCDEMQRLIDIVNTLKGKSKSESD